MIVTISREGAVAGGCWTKDVALAGKRPPAFSGS